MARRFTRREIITLGGLAGIAALPGAALGGGAKETRRAEGEPLPQVPRRVLGKTGATIPILLVGGAISFDRRFDPRLAEALRFGVNYFDTADCYAGGNSEIAVGNFLEKTGKRKEAWITTKSDRHDPEGLEATLATSLRKLKTDYVDLLFLHALKDPRRLDAEVMRTAEKLKKAGKIRFFGFSCHDGTVAELLEKAAALPWIDAIMFRYNFHAYGDKRLNDAIDRCHGAGIGLIAMKTQGSAVSFIEKVKEFEGSRFSRPQAVLKAVWADERITAAVSHMDTLEKMKENIAAALNKTKLTRGEQEALQRYAAESRHTYCAGCDQICNAHVPEGLEIGKTLRYLMYHDTYRDIERARAAFAQLPEEAKRIEGVDFGEAMKACPHGLDIARYMKRAIRVLT